VNEVSMIHKRVKSREYISAHREFANVESSFLISPNNASVEYGLVQNLKETQEEIELLKDEDMINMEDEHGSL